MLFVFGVGLDHAYAISQLDGHKCRRDTAISATKALAYGQTMTLELIATLEKERLEYSPKDPTSKANYPGITSIIALLNYYEFVALGVLSEDLDEELTYRSLRGMLCGYYVRYYPLIEKLGGSTGKQFANLKLLFNEWADPSEKAKIVATRT